MRANSRSMSELTVTTPRQLQQASQPIQTSQHVITTFQINRERMYNLRVATITDVVICICFIIVTGVIIYLAFVNNFFIFISK